MEIRNWQPDLGDEERVAWPFAALVVGGVLFVEKERAAKARSAAYTWAARKGWQFRIRQTVDGVNIRRVR